METESNISLSLDGNAQSFYNYLKDLEDSPCINITLRKVKQLRQVTNLDQSIKQYVNRHRVKAASNIALHDKTIGKLSDD